MKRNNLPQVKALKWHLEFLSDNLAALSDLDFDRRVVEARHYFTTAVLVLPLDDPLWQPIESYWYDLHAEFKGVESPKGIDWWKRVLTKIQADLRKLLKRAQSEGSPIPIGNAQQVIGMSAGRFFTKYHLPYAYDDLFTLGRMKRLARMSFANSLHGIDLEAINICKDETCGRFFLHLSEKPKFYCSSKCTTRDLSRKRREADPEAYRKKQREIMRKKYREKKAKKLGVSPDKVKIQKRTRSRKKTSK